MRSGIGEIVGAAIRIFYLCDIIVAIIGKGRGVSELVRTGEQVVVGVKCLGYRLAERVRHAGHVAVTVVGKVPGIPACIGQAGNQVVDIARDGGAVAERVRHRHQATAAVVGIQRGIAQGVGYRGASGRIGEACGEIQGVLHLRDPALRIIGRA